MSQYLDRWQPFRLVAKQFGFFSIDKKNDIEILATARIPGQKARMLFLDDFLNHATIHEWIPTTGDRHSPPHHVTETFRNPVELGKWLERHPLNPLVDRMIA